MWWIGLPHKSRPNIVENLFHSLRSRWNYPLFNLNDFYGKKIMKRFFIWLQEEEGWKAFLAIVYAGICVFDFVLVPTWIGIIRELSDVSLTPQLIQSFDSSVQLRIIEAYTFQHEPLTLKGGGIFHLAFGALLTGSAITARIKTK